MPLRLCIDPGHGYSNAEPGRYDTGAVAGGVEEADLVLMWARTGEWVLGQPPFSISTWLTRTHDSPAPLSTRNEQAEMRGCTHLISLHCNSSTGTTASGTETFHRDASDRLLAEIVQRAALEALTLRDRGLKLEQNAAQGRLAILDFNGPACLLELGFITNPTDRSRMLERDRRIAFWQRVGEGILRVYEL